MHFEKHARKISQGSIDKEIWKKIRAKKKEKAVGLYIIHYMTTAAYYGHHQILAKINKDGVEVLEKTKSPGAEADLKTLNTFCEKGGKFVAVDGRTYMLTGGKEAEKGDESKEDEKGEEDEEAEEGEEAE